jgi:hypothetical protein
MLGGGGGGGIAPRISGVVTPLVPTAGDRRSAAFDATATKVKLLCGGVGRCV